MLEQFLEEENKKKEEDKERKEKLLKRFEKARSKWQKFENQNLDEQLEGEDAEEFARETTNGAKPPRHKFMTPDLRGETLKKSQYMKEINEDTEELKKQKTLVMNQLFHFEQKHQMMNNLERVQIDDKNVVRPCDTKIISASTLETLFKYFELVVGEKPGLLQKRLHEQWIERQGRKPNKFKRLNKKEGAAPVEGGETESEEEAAEDENEDAEDDENKSQASGKKGK